MELMNEYQVVAEYIAKMDLGKIVEDSTRLAVAYCAISNIVVGILTFLVSFKLGYLVGKDTNNKEN